MEKEEENATLTEWKYMGEAYESLREKVRTEWQREVQITGRSNRWWKREWKKTRKEARKSKKARRA